MKSVNIVKKLEKQGYNIIYKKWTYWNNIPYVVLNGFDFAIAEMKDGNSIYLNLDFIFNHVQEALDIAQRNNPIFLKKIKELPQKEWERKWCYNRCLILSMDDYYRYTKRLYPYENYYKVLEKLKKEYN